MRIAIIQRDKCNPISCGEWCIKKCPVNRTGKECIIIATHKKAIIDEELCTGCGICVKCPFEAIKILNLPEKLKEKPVHKYGQNQFELYHLPLIKENKIIGIIGRNGIGKSTALSILSNNIQPNLSNFKKSPQQKQVIDHYSKSYLHDYFKKLYDHKIKISYKPQRIELLPKLYKGTVKELIKKIDEKNLGEKLLKELSLDKLKDRDISKLSGGELQRLAIIATLIKKADIYYFDEPASFLDITQRIKTAQLIRELAGKATVIVIEHDLATLDYISDEIQIIYGEPAAYGIISQSKSVRRGINEYLDGYLPDDNVRFRDYSIKFTQGRESKTIKETLFEFPELKKEFKTFSLKVNSGKIHKGEILTIMGSNGLGKTTFLKMLAGIEKPNKGKLPKLKISYKPQYLEQLKGTVESILKKFPESKSGWYKQNILEKLNLKSILKNKISTLSGGELQKLHIAICLSQNADIFALDEPSAFIDVEDRLKIAEIIRDFVTKKEVCAIVVDHDVQFIDYLGDSMLVFEGIPAKKGSVIGPLQKKQGMNHVLKQLNITYRRDQQNLRPRINKPGSQLDIRQRKENNYYYV